MGKMKKLVGKLSLSQKGGASPLGVACAAWLEQLAVVYANCGAFSNRYSSQSASYAFYGIS